MQSNIFLFTVIFTLIILISYGKVEDEMPVPYDMSVNKKTFSLTDEESSWLLKHKTIRIAGPLAFPPFHYIDKDGSVKGMASDYIRILSQRLGVKMQVQTGLTWPEILEKTKAGEIDLLSCAARTAGRESYLNFTNPYISFPMVIITRKNSEFIGGLKDLHGKKLACVRKATTCDWMERDKIGVIPYFTTSPLKSLEAVSMGFADAYLGNLAASSYLIEKNGLLNLKIAAPTPYGNYDLSFAVRKDWPELADILNKVLDSITQEEHSYIRQKWIAVRYEYGINPAKIRETALQIGGAAGIIIILIFLWNRQIGRREERFRCLIEHGTDIIQAFKEDGSIIYQSPSHTKILGYTENELLRTCAFNLFHESDKDAWERIMEQLLKGKGIQVLEHRIQHARGHYLYFESYCVNLLDNKALKAIVLNSRETTQRRQTQEALKNAKEAAEAANKAKSAFLANMSHELRTPLNAILGFTQLMSRSRKLAPEHIEYLDIVMKSGTHLLDLINDVLDMSKIEAGRIILREDNFDIWRMLDDLESMLRLRAYEKGLELIFERTSDVPRYIKSDEAKLRQILINLLNNALKFTLKGRVVLRTRMKDISSESRNDKCCILFEVEDTGPGIVSDKLERIFEPFVQSSAGINSDEGTGLGLPISRKFVQLMGGEMTVKSEIGTGTIFRFYIYAELADADKIRLIKPLRRVTGLKADQPRYRILIVDDKWDNRRLLIKLLEPVGFEVREAENGKEALEIWSEWEPHLIWMDMRMPVMDGYEAVKKIKETIKGQAAAVIALTASTFEDEQSIVLSAGCDDFLRKPFRESEIFDLMHTHIGVEYIYEIDEEIEDKKPLPMSSFTGDVIAELPSELISSMKKAAIEGDMTEMENLIDKIRIINPELADTLSVFAHEFEYEKILELIHKK